MRFSYKTYQIPFRHPFTISKGTKTHQPTFIVALEHFGIRGYGEAPAISYYNITVEKMIEDLERKRKFVEQFAFSDPERYWHYLHHLFPDNPFLVCALDMAGWDLFGKIKRKPLSQLWGLNTDQSPLTDFTIGIDDIETMTNKMLTNPWPIYKVKVGFENDVETIAALRSKTSSAIRVDANAAWNLETALQKIPLLKELGVELVEQPLAKDDWEGMKVLYEHSPLPLIADESCVFENDVQQCAGHFHGINIKLTKCSGITPARRMLAQARSLDLRIMIGCMNESTIGSAAIAQLAPLADYIDNDGTLLQLESVGEGIAFENGQFLYNTNFGLGVQVDLVK